MDGNTRANGALLRFVEKSSASLFAGGAILFFSALTLHQISTSPVVTVDLAQWNWLGGIHLRVDQEGPSYKSAQALAELTADPLVLKSAPVIQVQASPNAPSHSRHPKRIVEKPVHLTSAHPKAVIVSRGSPAPMIVQQEPASEKELLDIQGIHWLLHGRFTAALEEVSDSTKQIAQAQTELVPGVTSIQRVAKAKVRKQKSRQTTVAGVTASEKPQSTAMPDLTGTTSAAPTDAPHDSVSSPSTGSISSPLVPLVRLAPQLVSNHDGTQPDSARAPSAERTPEMATQHEGEKGVAQLQAQSSAKTLTLLAQNAVGHTGAGSDYSNRAGYPAPALNSQARQESNTHISARAVIHASDLLRTWTGNEEVDQPAVPKPELVEAFDGAEIADAYSEQFSTEGQYQRGWMKAQAGQHWPTLYWNSGTQTLPLISQNSVRLMAAKSGVALQDGAGIVFGKIAPGWRVEFSGRSEVPYFFDSQNQLVPANQPGIQGEGERTFVFVNAAPGAQLVYAMNSAGDQVAAVATPVLPGTSTYLELTDSSSVSLKGVVFDGQSNRTFGIANAQVSVIGQPKAFVTTDAQGVFAIDHITQMGSYPLYLDSNRGKEYTHRYRVIMGDRKEKNVALARLSERQLTESLEQLQGGISPESGIVIAAVPGLIARVMDPALTPSVTSLATTPNLVPETYTISSSGQLAIQESLRAGFQRFVSVQIPEGPALVQTVGRQKTPLWSELLFISRGVVNVVGPVN